MTAYLTAAAERILPLNGDQDRLYVDATLGSVAAGLTDPYVIERFLKRKVRCYSVEGLHAKVYIADGVMFCGSANATGNSSSESLQEACVQVKKTAIIAQFEDWLASLRWELIDLKIIEKLKSVYKPPRWQPGRSGRKKPLRAQSWITWVTESKRESDKVDKYIEELASNENLELDDIDYITISASRRAGRLFREAQRGDEVFIVDHSASKRFREPVRVVAASKVVGDRRVLALAYNDDKSVTFRRLLRTAASAGMHLPDSGRTERALSPRNAAALRRMFILAK